jgi:hypothetical protein
MLWDIFFAFQGIVMLAGLSWTVYGVYRRTPRFVAEGAALFCITALVTAQFILIRAGH